MLPGYMPPRVCIRVVYPGICLPGVYRVVYSGYMPPRVCRWVYTRVYASLLVDSSSLVPLPVSLVADSSRLVSLFPFHWLRTVPASCPFPFHCWARKEGWRATCTPAPGTMVVILSPGIYPSSRSWVDLSIRQLMPGVRAVTAGPLVGA